MNIVNDLWIIVIFVLLAENVTGIYVVDENNVAISNGSEYSSWEIQTNSVAFLIQNSSCTQHTVTLNNEPMTLVNNMMFTIYGRSAKYEVLISGTGCEYFTFKPSIKVSGGSIAACVLTFCFFAACLGIFIYFMIKKQYHSTKHEILMWVFVACFIATYSCGIIGLTLYYHTGLGSSAFGPMSAALCYIIILAVNKIRWMKCHNGNSSENKLECNNATFGEQKQ